MVREFDQQDVDMLVPKLAVQQVDGSWVFSWPAGLGRDRLCGSLDQIRSELLARLGGTHAPLDRPTQ